MLKSAYSEDATCFGRDDHAVATRSMQSRPWRLAQSLSNSGWLLKWQQKKFLDPLP